MPRIPLEDNFTDIINKAQRGLQFTDDALAAADERARGALLRRLRRALEEDGREP